MPLLIEILAAIGALSASAPEIIALVTSAIQIVQTGVVTPEQEASIRAQLDGVKAQIDGATT